MSAGAIPDPPTIDARERSATPSYPPVVVFDLDGTLLTTTTVSLFLAERLGHGDALAHLERRFREHEISNRVVTDASAPWFEGCSTSRVWHELAQAPWIDGIAETLASLRSAGTRLLLATITWKFAAELLASRHRFAAVSGTEMEAVDGTLSGRVTRYFDEHDKVRFVETWCRDHGVDMAEIAAVGDSRSDVPLFGRVGFSIAINATSDARAAATRAVEASNLREVLPLLAEARASMSSSVGG